MTATPRTFRAVACVALAGGLTLVTACGSDDDSSENQEKGTSTEQAAQPVEETDWFNNTFESSPFIAQGAKDNPQAYRATDPAGAPLPEDAADDEIVWQLPSCVISPFTGAGPTNASLGNGHLMLSGYDHSEAGAVAAGMGLFTLATEASDLEAGVRFATASSETEAQRIVATSDSLTPGHYSPDGDSACPQKVVRSTHYKVVNYSDKQAVIDYYLPMTVDGSKGTVLRITTDWRNGDWSLNPASFSSYDSVIEEAQKGDGEGRAVDLSEFTSW